MAIKTLHLTNAYHPTSGGIRTFYRALLARANAERRPMRLVVPGEADAVETVGEYGRIYFIAAPPAPLFDRRYRLLLPQSYLRASTRLREILAAEQPDLVEICDKYSLPYLAALLRKGLAPGIKRPVLVGLSCERMDDNVAAYLGSGRIGRALTRGYVRHLYGPPFDVHIANSEYTADELRRALWDRSTDFVRVCPMGVESTAFGPVNRDAQRRRRLLEQAGGTRDSVLLLYAGRVSPEKNPRLLIETLERLVRPARGRRTAERDYRLVIAGEGADHVGARENPDEAPVLRDRQAVVPRLGRPARSFRQRLARIDGVRRGSHRLARGAGRDHLALGCLRATAAREPAEPGGCSTGRRATSLSGVSAGTLRTGLVITSRTSIRGPLFPPDGPSVGPGGDRAAGAALGGPPVPPAGPVRAARPEPTGAVSGRQAPMTSRSVRRRIARTTLAAVSTPVFGLAGEGRFSRRTDSRPKAPTARTSCVL